MRTTNTILDKILAQKVIEIRARQAKTPLNKLINLAKIACAPRNFTAALQRDTVALIAEVKKASPSKGVLIEDFDPVKLGKTYAQNGAAAISVLTDEMFFQGSLDYLTQVRDAVKIPVLRKDFIIDPYQVYEARAAEADAVLLIVAALDDGLLAELYALIYQLGMTALVEVHDEIEMERALKLEATVIGVNNRDLKTFNVDLRTTSRLAQMIPKNVTLVAESGIYSAADVLQMAQAGAHAVLVGESLVKSEDIAGMVRTLSSQMR
ncbi:MAG: indole-3-glycerol phosphate synthase TrpC [Phototrophicales bacterium]|nr:MAG: indole-3-glycerol phosphate synthase TrpC [Phototrophicales bacterium]RMG71723.1 MAG: indole-3-glycerol phosphate synthase TrpC [Chloroflexota bacterium]